MRLRYKLVILAGLLALIAGVISWRFHSTSRTLDALAKNIYWEAAVADEPELGMRMVAYVTHQRALQNRRYWGGADIIGVVFARHKKLNGGVVCQFSWTCLPAKDAEPQLRAKWQQSLAIARDELDGKFKPPSGFEGATSYLNPRASARKNVCEFKQKLVALGHIDPASRHEFYREPTSASDRASLPLRKDIPECQTSKPKSSAQAHK